MERETTLDFNLTHPDAIFPKRATKLSAGWDLFSVNDITIEKNSITKINTGLQIKEISKNIYIQISSRSGLAINDHCTVVGGIIDSDFRGTIQVLLMNTSGVNKDIKTGERIAQMIILPRILPKSETLQKETISRNSKRGQKGLGSTGL